MKRLTINSLNKLFTNKGYFVEIVRGSGYWYFVSTLPEQEIKGYEASHSVYVVHLNNLDSTVWELEAQHAHKVINLPPQ